MKNQDIFEVFKHLKTLLGGHPPQKNEGNAQKNEKGEGAIPPPMVSEREARLRDFHLKHDALSRKITAEHSSAKGITTTLISPRERKDFTEQKKSSTTHLAMQVQGENAENTPLFPPSFP